MLAAVSAFLLLGYTLVYAAVANGGSLARNPWLALTTDAYAVSPDGTTSSTSTPSTFDQVLGWAAKLSDPVGALTGLIP